MQGGGHLMFERLKLGVGEAVGSQYQGWFVHGIHGRIMGQSHPQLSHIRLKWL
jgi:hypothetical protein